MDIEGQEESQNVEDRRGLGKTVGIAAGGGGAILLIILGLIFGVDPQQLAQVVNEGQQQQQGQPHQENPEEKELAHFTKVIFGDTETIWTELFRKMGKTYPNPTLVLYSGSVQSACGQADSAVGPFYCPGDQKVYIDLSFYQDMQRKLNAPGDFARAYVVAHEVGHHVQGLLGYSKWMDEARRRGNKVEINQVSVRQELQADYFAGVWAYHGQERYHFLQKGDVESALNAAFEIGDDRLQKKARGFVVPDSFTHGTSQQRQRWFMEGFKTGDVDRARLLFERDYNEL
jgi:predicted metalloprotease